jgi:DNA-binding transcriptional LysR family regulator
MAAIDIAGFINEHEAVRVSLDEAGGALVVREVREGAADLGVVWDAVDVSGLQAWPYRADHLGVVMPPSHPLARRQRIRFADTLEHVSVGVVPGGLLDNLLRRQAALLGLAILPFEAAAPQVGSLQLVMRPLHEPWATRQFVIVSREGEWLSAAARLLVQHLRGRAAR